MQEFMPKQEAYLGKLRAFLARLFDEIFTNFFQPFLDSPAPQISERNEVLKDKNSGPWPAKRRRAALYRNMGLLCCISRQHPNYL